MGDEEKTVSVRVGPPRKSSADWLYPLRPEAGRKSGHLRLVTRRYFVPKANNNGGPPTNGAVSPDGAAPGDDEH